MFILRRYKFNENNTLGKLYHIDAGGKEVYVCDTLEDKDRHLETAGASAKVYGKTAIPLGEYGLSYAYWAKHKNYYPLLQKVPYFSGIFIHGGVTENDSLGCILVGTLSGSRLLYSGKAMEKIRAIMKISKNERIKVMKEVDQWQLS